MNFHYACSSSLAKFGQIQDTVFILDGDQRSSDIENRIQEAAGRGVNISILFLPGKQSPESWILDSLKNISSDEVSEQLGIKHQGLSTEMRQLDAIYNAASESPSEIAKNKLRSLSEDLNKEASEICRIVARLEADNRDSDIQPLVDEIRGILRQWRG